MLFDYEEHPGKTRWASWTLAFIGRWVTRPFIRLRIEKPQQVQSEGPVLIISKHSAEIDIPLGYYAMLAAFGRHAWCVMKASLARPRYMGFFWKIGGIPLDRDNPERSKKFLMFAKKKMYEGNMLVLFPEQTTFMNTMGEGKVPGFRFIAGKPQEPLMCYPVGFTYRKGMIRTQVNIRFGEPVYFKSTDDPAAFLHSVMKEIARLSELEYPFEAPEPRSRARVRT